MMTAQLQMKRMLDGLMGTGRNGEDTSENLSFTSPRVCKSHLLRCCPHDVLSATRCELGPCPRTHNVALRADYELALKSQDYETFQKEVLETLRKFLSESERRSNVAKKRLKLTQEVLNEEETIRTEKIKRLDEKIKESLTKAEELGASGDVEETLKITKSVEELQKQLEDAEADYKNTIPTSKYQQEKLRVCEVCCSYLGVDDNDKRLADHFSGRMHLGFLLIREKVEELENAIQDKYIKRFLDNEFGNKEPKMEQAPKDENQKEKSRSPDSKHSSRHRSHHHKNHGSHSRSHKRRHRHSSKERDSSTSDKKIDDLTKSSTERGSAQASPAVDIPFPVSQSQ